MQKGHVLKFVLEGKTCDDRVGIKTFPRQTYGVSEDSPDYFRQGHTLIGEHGYAYRHENNPQFYYPSQKKSYNIHHEEDEEDFAQLQGKLLRNSAAFHRKKGRLTEFMDKNGWMGTVTPLMGFERNPQARQFSNRDREKRIQSLTPRVVYEPHNRKPKVNQDYYKTISTLMSQKLKIRKQRNMLGMESRQASVRVQPKQPDPIQVENVVEKMGKTSLDFYSTSSTFYNRNDEEVLGRKKESAQLSFRTSKRGQSPGKDLRERGIENRIEEDLKLQKWYQQSCHSKWAYNPKQADFDDQL